jgi:hypothetical protein
VELVSFREVPPEPGTQRPPWEGCIRKCWRLPDGRVVCITLCMAW